MSYIATSTSRTSVSWDAVSAALAADPAPPMRTRSLSRKWFVARVKPGNVAPRKSVFRAGRRAMGGNHYHRSRTGHSHDFDNDVRARGRARRLGAPHSSVARDPKTYRRIYRICPAGIHSRKDAPLPPWWSKARSKTRRTSARARACTCVASRGNQELASLLGEAGFRNFARVFAGGSKRFQRHAHGREHFKSCRRNFRRIRFAGRISCQDSLDWTSPSGTVHDLQNSAHI